MTESDNQQPPQLQHHHLIMGEVIYLDPEDKQMHSMRLNGILVTPEARVSAKNLGNAQQALQINLHQRRMAAGIEQLVDVKDVVLHSLTYLGVFTQAEFQVPPPEESSAS